MICRVLDVVTISMSICQEIDLVKVALEGRRAGQALNKEKQYVGLNV